MKTVVSLFIGAAIITVILLGFAKLRQDTVFEKPARPTSPPSSAQKTPEQTAPVITVATGLEVPWAIAFLPEGGDMLVTERSGSVRLVRKSGGLDPNPLLTIEDVEEIGEGGLMGVAIHPDFPQKPYVYFYYTTGQRGSQTTNQLVRYTFEDGAFSDKIVLIEAIPGAPNHDGGRIKFGPDSFLYITTGDSQEPSLAQNRNSFAGKILRVTDEGKPAPGNPFISGGGNPLVYSYGHRNPQGISWNSSGNLWATEHGRSAPTGLDEINLIESGQNYGWPTIQGDETRSGMVTPKRNSGPTTTWAPSGAAFVNNSLFFAGLRGETLYEAAIKGDNVTQLKEHFKGQFGRLREVVLSPDGMLYVTTSNRDGRGSPSNEDDRIIKIDPNKL